MVFGIRIDSLVINYVTAQTQGRNIRHYSNYLQERARAYRDTNIDWVRAKEPRLEKLSVEKGLLRETEAVQNQLTALLKCDVCLWRIRSSRDRKLIRV